MRHDTALAAFVAVLLLAACGGRGGAAPYSAVDAGARDALEVWQADPAALPAARTVHGVELRVESIDPPGGAEWEQGTQRGRHLPIAFRVTLQNRSDHAVSVMPSQAFVLDDRSRRLGVAGFRSIDGVTSYFATPVRPGGRQVWEVGFRPDEGTRGLPPRLSLVLRMQGPDGSVSEPFSFARRR